MNRWQIRLLKANYQPSGPSWALRTARQELAYWRQLSKIALDVKDRDLSRGLDKNGVPMVPISERTRANRYSEMGTADPNAPPLTPAYGLSRTRSLLVARVATDAVVLWWKHDIHTGASWGEILAFHARGAGRLPKRDVIGISLASQLEIRKQAQSWWDGKFRKVPIERKPAAAPIRKREREIAARAKPAGEVIRPRVGVTMAVRRPQGLPKDVKVWVSEWTR